MLRVLTRIGRERREFTGEDVGGLTARTVVPAATMIIECIPLDVSCLEGSARQLAAAVPVPAPIVEAHVRRMTRLSTWVNVINRVVPRIRVRGVCCSGLCG